MMIRRTRRWPRCRQQFLLAFGGLLPIVAVTMTAAAGLEQARTAIIFLALVTVGELCRFVLPGNREIAPVASASALGYALLQPGNEPAIFSSSQVIAIVAAGMLVGALPSLAARRPLQWTAMARRLIVVAVTASLFWPLARITAAHVWWVELALMTLCLFLSFATDLSYRSSYSRSAKPDEARSRIP